MSDCDHRHKLYTSSNHCLGCKKTFISIIYEQMARIKELEARELGWLTTLSSMELEARQLRDATFAVGEVREHNGSLMVIGALRPQIELDTLPIGTKVYIKLGGGE